MYIYFILLTLSFVLKPILDNKKIYFIIVFGLLGVFSGIRGESVGVDTWAYHNLFIQYSDESLYDLFLDYDYENKIDVELGFQIFISILSFFTEEPQVMIFISSILSFVLLGRFIYNNTNNNYWIAISLIVSMGHYFYSLAVLRQFLSTSIAIQCFDFIKKDCWFKGASVILIASTIHSSAIIFMPVCCIAWILKKYQNNGVKLRNAYIVCMATMVVVCVLGSFFLINNLELMPLRLAKYFMPDNPHNIASPNGIYIWMVVLLYAITIFATLAKVDSQKSIQTFFGVVCLTFAVFIYFMKEYMIILSRLVFHFEPFLWILLSDLMANISYKYVRCYLYLLFIVISYFILSYLGVYYNWESVPYCFF